MIDTKQPEALRLVSELERCWDEQMTSMTAPTDGIVASKAIDTLEGANK